MKRFIREDDGAVTVDWVVLTAAICGLSLAVIYSIKVSGIDGTAERLSTFLAEQPVGD